MSNSTTIEFEVDGKPPRKRNNQSIWKHAKEAPRVALLRKKALEACKSKKLEGHFNQHPVKLEIEIFAPNITNRAHVQENSEDPKGYVGDLDSFATGICDSLKPINPQVKLEDGFQGKDDVDPAMPIILKDDSQVVSIIITKTKSKKSCYVIAISSNDDEYL